MIGVKSAQGRITYEEGNKEAWICICGNRPDADGFYPCDKEGNEMEPVEGWEDLYLCANCGRIIHKETLEAVGRAGKASLQPSRVEEGSAPHSLGEAAKEL